MKTLHRRCAGLDVHSDTVVACARLTARTKASHEVRRFSTATRDLLELADWLAAQGVTHVAMEATGVYWKPVWHMLEGRFELVLANAAHIRNVPDRVIDVALAAGNIADVSGICEHKLEPALQHMPDRLPVDASGLHCHVRDALRRQPIRQFQKIA